VASSPSFHFYPKDWLTSSAVQGMSNHERGIYITLLCHCWLEGSVPSDPNTLSRLTNERFVNFIRAWRRSLSHRFYTGDDGRLRNRRLELERSKQKAYYEQQREKGHAGAQQRWHGRCHAPAIRKTWPEHGIPSTSTTIEKGVIRSTVPPQNGAAIQNPPLTPAELTFATLILRKRLGRCDHDPPCETPTQCVAQIASGIRAKKRGV